LTRGAASFKPLLEDPAFVSSSKILSLGVVDGRNIWKNDFQKSLDFVADAIKVLSENRVMVAPSSSLLHSPYDLDLEKNEEILTPDIKNWMAFAKQKLSEVTTIAKLTGTDWSSDEGFLANQKAIESRKSSSLIHKPAVKNRVLPLKSRISSD
jgi:5-methyltetrahydropteroyltriglutamate--homocysteine methyltransferase